MNRRAFLAGAAAIAAAAVLDPERLLWVPGAKTFFLPSPKPEPVIAACAFHRGDVITINGLYARHPITDRELPFLARFIVTDDVQGGTIVNAKLWPPVTPQQKEREGRRFAKPVMWPPGHVWQGP